jgi:hypothetical protein
MTESALTYTDLQERFGDLASTENATVLARALRWMNDCQYRVIVGKKLRFMRDITGSITVASATNQGTLPTDFDEEIKIEDDGNDDKELIKDDYDDFETSYSGDPSKYAFVNGTTIEINGSLSAARTLNLFYYGLPTPMSASSTTSDLPNEWRVAILVNYALHKFFKGKDDTRSNEFYELYRQARDDMYDKYHQAAPREDLGMEIDDERPEYKSW